MASDPPEIIAYINKLANIAAEHPDQAAGLLDLIWATLAPARGADPTVSELAALKEQGKIPAIKLYRARTGVSLKEAKDAIEKAGIRLGLYEPKTWD